MKISHKRIPAACVLLLALALTGACESGDDETVLLTNDSESALSTTAMALVMAQAQPGGAGDILKFRATDVTMTTIRFAWTASPPAGTARFDIYKAQEASTAGTSPYVAVSLPGDTHKYLFGEDVPFVTSPEKLFAGKEYFFRLAAVDAQGNELARQIIGVKMLSLADTCRKITAQVTGGFYGSQNYADQYLVWDGSYYYKIGYVYNRYPVHDDYSLEKYDENGNLLSSTALSWLTTDGAPFGLTFDGSHLWFSVDSASNPQLLAVHPATGALARSLGVPYGVNEIAYDARNERLLLLFYYLDIQAIDPVTGGLERVYSNPLGISYMRGGGIAVRGDEIWVADRGNTDLIAVIDSKSGKTTGCMESPATGFFDHITSLSFKDRNTLILKKNAASFVLYHVD